MERSQPTAGKTAHFCKVFKSRCAPVNTSSGLSRVPCKRKMLSLLLSQPLAVHFRGQWTFPETLTFSHVQLLPFKLAPAFSVSDWRPPLC